MKIKTIFPDGNIGKKRVKKIYTVFSPILKVQLILIHKQSRRKCEVDKQENKLTPTYWAFAFTRPFLIID